MSPRLARLAAIATAAGAFSALFGVGGGTLIVPLLILWCGYAEREATGTSLAAIAAIAAFGAVGQGLYGNVRPSHAVIVGVPALAGVVAGTWFQQRIAARAVSAALAVLLVVSALVLIL